MKEGEKPRKKIERGNICYLSSAKDWTMRVDLESRLKIPEEIVVTSLRPDVIVISKTTKQLGIIELTVPTEERIEISGELKRLKYEEIAQEAKKNGWRVKIWAIEVGCRGFPAISLSTFLKDMGYQGGKRKKIVDRIGKTAEQASQTLWKCSFHKNWGNKGFEYVK